MRLNYAISQKARLCLGPKLHQGCFLSLKANVVGFQVWFWRFRSDARQKVYKKMEKAKALRKDFDVYNKVSQKKYSDAKAQLGVWSEAGVAEGRKLFWDSFETGKVFGRRQTFWDGLVRFGLRQRLITVLPAAFTWFRQLLAQQNHRPHAST